jgi:hypothetical protein
MSHVNINSAPTSPLVQGMSSAIQQIPALEINTKSKKAKCHSCKGRLGAVPMTCRCGHQFCMNHLAAMEHKCTFDYRASANTVLTRQLDNTGLSLKVDKI